MAAFKSKSNKLVSHTIVFFISFAPILASSIPNLSENKLVYKNCTNQTIPIATTPPPPMLSLLLQELVEKSSNSKFYETNVGDDTIAISGLFQCRGDLSNDECHNCMTKLPELSNTLCGLTIPARIQLSGCYIHYKPDGPRTFSHYLQHKSCGEPIGELSGSLQEAWNGAFVALLGCIASSRNGYCDMWYESMHVVGQCEGSLGDCGCGECVNNAAQLAQDECGDSISGEIYMENCYISYTYDSDHGSPGNYTPEKENGASSAKLVAIVVGGGAALCLGLLCCRFVRASRRKNDDW